MAPITWGTTVSPPDGDIVRRVPALVTVDVGIQDDILAHVNTALDTRLFDLGEADPRLKLARIYLALHYATGGAANASGTGAESTAGPITGRAMDGVSETYASIVQSMIGVGLDALLLAESYWGRRYLQLVRAKRHGMLTV